MVNMCNCDFLMILLNLIVEFIKMLYWNMLVIEILLLLVNFDVCWVDDGL